MVSPVAKKGNVNVVIGMGDLTMDELGCALDLLIRTMHRFKKNIIPVVEDVPDVRGLRSDLALKLDFVNMTIDHWLTEVFELPIIYVPPGRWKNSRVANSLTPVSQWNGQKTSQHMRDAYTIAIYEISVLAVKD